MNIIYLFSEKILNFFPGMLKILGKFPNYSEIGQ